MSILLCLFVGCASPAKPLPTHDFWNTHVTRVVGEPTGPTCTVVAVHGYGASPESLTGLFDGYPGTLQVVFPRAPTRVHEKGWSWYPTIRDTPPEVLAEAISAQADRLAEALPTLPHAHPMSGAPIVTGFSQGGMLSYAIAARHPDRIAAALPLSGFLPEPVWPTRDAALPVHAYHGDLDSIIEPEAARKTVDALKAHGYDATLTTYPNTTHSVPPPMRQDFFAALARECARQGS